MDSTKGTPSLVLPLLTRVFVKLISTLTGAASRRDGTVNRRLLNFLKYAVPANPNPIKGVSTFDITVDPNRNLWFRLFIPTVGPENKSLPVIVFYHGGGFAFLSPDVKNYDLVCRRFARKFSAIVVSVNYRLSPEHRYPAQIDDGYDILKFIDDEMNKGILPENADVTRCFLAGDSAGGNLAHHVALRAGESQFKKLKVIGLICIQPFFGGEERTESEITLSRIDPLVSIDRTDWLWKGYLPSGEGMNRDHEAVNVSGPRAVDVSQKEFPATLVVVAGFDSLKDWQKRYYEYLKRSGKEVKLLEYPRMIHAFYIFPELKESSELISEINDFVHNICSKL